MEVGAIASGLSYNGTDEEGNPRFDRIKSVVLWNLETSYKVKDFLANWNISVHNWLKYYVYLRMLPNDKRGINLRAAMLTFVVSAIWHGFYPGFLHFFVGAGLLDYHCKLCSLVIAPKFRWVPDWLQIVVCWIWCYSLCGYFVLSFVLLNFSDFWPVYEKMNFAGHLVLVGTIMVMVPFVPKTEKAVKRE
jgi:lysophospholipid acyltransferase